MSFHLDGSFATEETMHTLAAEISSSTGGDPVYNVPVSVAGDVTVAADIDSTSEELAIGGNVSAQSLVVYDSVIEVGGKIDVEIIAIDGDSGGKVTVGAPSNVPLVFQFWGGELEGPLTATVFAWDDNDNSEDDYERLAGGFEAVGLELSDEVSLDDVITLVEEAKVQDLVAYFQNEQEG